MVEHSFCPKFTYFGKVLGIKEHEEIRGTVIAGKLYHLNKAVTNKNYIPVDIVKGEKIIEKTYFSKKFDYLGKIDQAIISNDSVTIIEFKYGNKFIGKTLLVQLGLQALLLEENLKKECKEALVEFIKDKTGYITVPITEELKNSAITELYETKEVIEKAELPFSRYDNRCIDCSYKRICPVGSLKIDQ